MIPLARTVAGAPLMVLSALWLAARVLFALPSPSLLAPAIIADVGYGALLFALMSREVIAARNQRNYKVLVILGLLPVTNALFFLGMQGNATWTMTATFAGLWLVVSWNRSFIQKFENSSKYNSKKSNTNRSAT